MKESTFEFWTLIIAAIGLLIAFGTTIWQSILIRQQMKLNFFADYTKRYQEIMLNLPVDINSPNYNLEELSKETYEIVLRNIRAYFDLCSEQLFLRKRRKVDKIVWRDWEEGMIATISHKAFQDAWNILKFYDEFNKWVVK